jgi:hypothetical protein
MRFLPCHPSLFAILITLVLHVGWAEGEETGFVSMFDGKTLNGWQVSSKQAQQAWFVKDGMIVGNGDKGRSYLIYDRDRDVANFELKFRYRLPDKGNTGVNIRARVDDAKRRDYQAYHADLGHIGIGKNVLGAWDFHTPGRKEHGCNRGQRLVIDAQDQATYTEIEDAVTVADIRDRDWNDVRVIARDNRFQMYLNGKLSAEFIEHLPPQRRLHRGMIQFQLHDPGMVVHFKDLYLKILK